MIRKVLSVLALASVTAVAANAQAAAEKTVAARPVTFGVKAGGSIPVSDFGDFAKTGFIVGAQVGYSNAALPVSLRADVDYNRYSLKTTGNSQVWGFTGNVIYDLPVKNAIKPYVLAGAGLFTAKAGGASENNFGFNAGAGVKIPLSGFNTFIEAKYTRVSTEGTAMQFLPITFGISL